GASAGEVPCWPSFLPSVAPFFFACFLWDLPSDVAASFFFSSFFSCVAKVGTESESATAKATSRVSSFFICLLSIWVRTTTRAIYAPQFPHSPPSQNGWSRERVFGAADEETTVGIAIYSTGGKNSPRRSGPHPRELHPSFRDEISIA